ncbi:30S ribosomal protein S20 [bacterium]|nr:30S ribosomal protein S20 [bacterium]
MAHHKSAIKRIKTNEKSRQRNNHYKSLMKSTLKSVFSTTEKEAAEGKMSGAISLLDKLASKGIIHKNKAANQKSRVARHINSL